MDNYKSILLELKNKVYRPVYMLMGEESFYIDKIIDFIEKDVLNEQEKEFNLSVVYGMETTVDNVISMAQRFPMMGNYHLVIVKEAQNLKKIEKLQSYIKKPSSSTILVLSYKHKTIDKRTVFAKSIPAAKGIVFNSERIRDYKIPEWIKDYVSLQKFSIDDKTAQ